MSRLGVLHALAVLSTVLGCGGAEPPPEPAVTRAAPRSSAKPPSPRPFAKCSPPSAPVSDAGAPGAEQRSDAGSAPISDADHVIASLRSELKRCYQAGLNTDSLMQGCVVIKALVTPDGEVASVDTPRREGLSPDVEACLMDAVKKARFAPPGGGGSTLHIPITFVQQQH